VRQIQRRHESIAIVISTVRRAKRVLDRREATEQDVDQFSQIERCHKPVFIVVVLERTITDIGITCIADQITITIRLIGIIVVGAIVDDIIDPIEIPVLNARGIVREDIEFPACRIAQVLEEVVILTGLRRPVTRNVTPLQNLTCPAARWFRIANEKRAG
jgi:hypothetical protein